ncbi:DUF5683 domain-containing protein [Tunicatimonas pelagia]|uniref:DUF5683 domain-containing protein n=1 Tax=Tunicatimonas pelagia TaxID=931531 RepID=UPI002665D2A8|nr:DUF5683 domain-containing protein [Tunicatimonas pelagia]WKN40591.1 DUF5683 domain-containing protein [Tunicatimonas pelagia]
MKYALVGLILLIMTLLSISVAFAQEEKEESSPDTVTVVEDTLQLQRGAVGVNKPGTAAPDTIVIETIADQHSPRRAALYSAVLPGLGQAYNGKPWKIPIIYGGFITMGYFIILRNDQYQLFLRARNTVNNGGENPFSVFPRSRYANNDDFQSAIDNFGREREFMVILTAVLYGLNIMDAIADAHLIEFDVNPDLSMDLKPMAGSALAYHDHLTPTVPACGLSFTISLY